MKQDKKLMLGMTLLFLITFISLGTLVTTEKLAPFYTEKIETRINEYLEKNYQEEINDFELGKITYKNTKYQAKVRNKENKDLYFTIIYQNKKITDTYEEDYKEGKTLLKTYKKELEQEISKKINQEVQITFPLTLNKYTQETREKIINKKIDNTIYNIAFTLNTKLDIEHIIEKITEISTLLRQENITPNTYEITIKDQDTKLQISNITQSVLEKNALTEIINAIMNNEESNLIKEHNITYQYRKGE